MEGIQIRESNQVIELAKLADKVWHEYFPCILTEDQIHYMVDKFQSFHAITDQIQQGYRYFFLVEQGEVLGYIGIRSEEEKLFLSKLYLLKQNRGKGYASKALLFVEKIAKDEKLKSIYLTVNRENNHTVEVYLRKGFEIVKEQIADIGEGYVMDDYVMEKSIEKGPTS